MKINRSESGQALVIIVFAIIGLVVITGLVVDSGLAFSDRRNAQNAADTAVMAAGLAKIRGNDFSAAAINRAASNGYINSGQNSVTVSTTPTPAGACPDTGTDITVTIISVVPTTFAKIVGRTDVTNQVDSTTRVCDVVVTYIGTGGPLYAGASVYATKTSACGNGMTDKAIFMQGSSHLQVWGGDLGSASADGNCLDFRGGEALLKKAESGTACADVITAATSGGTFNSLKGADGCGNVYYGQSFDPPPPDLGITCAGTATKSGNTMSPGNFTGDFPPAGVKTLNPGVYCIDGRFIVNAGDQLSGTGVTIVMNTGNLRWNGNSEVKLSAPTSGDTQGLLIYFPPSNSSDVDVNGNSNAKITGTILAQNSDCFFAGSGQLQKQVLQFICYTWGMNGNGQAELVYDSTKFFQTPPAPIITNPTISILE